MTNSKVLRFVVGGALVLLAVWVVGKLLEDLFAQARAYTDSRLAQLRDETGTALGLLFRGQAANIKSVRQELEELRDDQHQINKTIVDSVGKLQAGLPMPKGKAGFAQAEPEPLPPAPGETGQPS